MSSYNALYPPNVGAQSAVHIHITDKEYNTQYMLIADTFTVHRETGKQNSKSAPVPQCGGYAFPVNVGFIPHINIGDVSTFPGVRRL